MRVPISRRLVALAAPALFCVAASATAAQPAIEPAPAHATSPPASVSVAATCAECHEEVVTAFGAGAHGRAWRHGEGYGEASCATCHGDGAKHIESGEAADIVNPPKLGAERISATCATCHDRGEHRLWPGSEHESAGLSCLDCHAMHAETPAARGVVRTSSELCLSCHGEQRASLGQRFRHPLAEGKMTCVSCHQPHGARSEKLVAKDSLNDLCWSCHQEKRGPFLWEHSPVREDCATCHVAHGSNHEGMLVARTTQLCQSCHLQGRHQTVAGFQTAMWNTNRGCLNCHTNIHGSNHPSGPLFQR